MTANGIKRTIARRTRSSDTLLAKEADRPAVSFATWAMPLRFERSLGSTMPPRDLGAFASLRCCFGLDLKTEILCVAAALIEWLPRTDAAQYPRLDGSRLGTAQQARRIRRTIHLGILAQPVGSPITARSSAPSKRAPPLLVLSTTRS